MNKKEKYIPFRNYIINPEKKSAETLTNKDAKALRRKKALDRFEEQIAQQELEKGLNDFF